MNESRFLYREACSIGAGTTIGTLFAVPFWALGAPTPGWIFAGICGALIGNYLADRLVDRYEQRQDHHR